MSDVRLIDANALKVALKSNCKPELCHDINTAWCESCCRTNDFEDLIDNAPTIEYPFYQEAYQTGYEEGYNDGKNATTINKCDNCDLMFKEKTMMNGGYLLNDSISGDDSIESENKEE